METEQQVAVKLIASAVNGTVEKGRLLNCAHENVVKLLSAFPSRSLYAIVMELCEGSVRDFYKRHGPLSDGQIQVTTRETLRGLEFIHSNHFLHRDIKAANILFTTSFGVKLLDFGITAEISTARKERSTICGSYPWMVSSTHLPHPSC